MYRMLERFNRWKVNWITWKTFQNINDTLGEECRRHCCAAMSHYKLYEDGAPNVATAISLRAYTVSCAMQIVKVNWTLKWIFRIVWTKRQWRIQNFCSGREGGGGGRPCQHCRHICPFYTGKGDLLLKKCRGRYGKLLSVSPALHSTRA